MATRPTPTRPVPEADSKTFSIRRSPGSPVLTRATRIGRIISSAISRSPPQQLSCCLVRVSWASGASGKSLLLGERLPSLVQDRTERGFGREVAQKVLVQNRSTNWGTIGVLKKFGASE